MRGIIIVVIISFILIIIFACSSMIEQQKAVINKILSIIDESPMVLNSKLLKRSAFFNYIKIQILLNRRYIIVNELTNDSLRNLKNEIKEHVKQLELITNNTIDLDLFIVNEYIMNEKFS